MKYFILLFLITSCTLSGFSQTKETFDINDSGITPPNRRSEDGKVTFTQDVLLRKAIKRHKEISNNHFDGWRVQIYFGSGQSAMGEAQSTKTLFLTKYGHEYGAYIDFDTPNFKVKVGDFRTKAEAMYFKSTIEKTFPNSWVVSDRVNYPINMSSSEVDENNNNNEN